MEGEERVEVIDLQSRTPFEPLDHNFYRLGGVVTQRLVSVPSVSLPNESGGSTFLWDGSNLLILTDCQGVDSDGVEGSVSVVEESHGDRCIISSPTSDSPGRRTP